MSQYSELNLKKDSETIYKYIIQRIRNYSSCVNVGPGKPENPISQISLGFQLEQSCWVALIFDTRPNSEPDGKWTLYIKENAIEFGDWLRAIESLAEYKIPIMITCSDDSKKYFNINADLYEIANCFGNMLRDILIRLRNEGAFNCLPIGHRCIMGVEELCGYYGWPTYENRLKEGYVSLSARSPRNENEPQ